MNVTPQPFVKKKSRVMIVDDHPMVRMGLTLVINGEPDLEVKSEAAGAGEALRAMGQSLPDLVIVDLSLQEGSGIDLIKQIKVMYESVKILVSSMHDETLFAERALQAGAMGYISKKEATERVVEAIRCVLAGKVYVSDKMSERLLAAVANQPQRSGSAIESLSNREAEVFQFLGEGYSTKEIAEKLHLSVKTIETHREKIKRKLGLKDHNELIRHAVQWCGEIGKGE